MVGAVPPVAPVEITNVRCPVAELMAMYDAEKEKVPTYTTPFVLNANTKQTQDGVWGHMKRW